MTAQQAFPLLVTLFVELTWKATVILAIAAAMEFAARRSPRTRHATWTSASIAMLMLPPAILLLPRRLIGWPASSLADLTAALGGVVPFSLRVGEVLVVTAGGPRVTGSAVLTDPGIARGMATQAGPAGTVVLLSLCAAGVLIQAVRLFRAHRYHHAVLADALPAPAFLHGMVRQAAGRLRMREAPQIVLSSGTAAPMVVGLLRHRIVLPSPWLSPPSTTEHVLLHELAHVRHRDNLAQLAAEAARALYCWHPAAWWMAHRTRLLREQAADAAVVAAGVAPTAYARTLVEQTRIAKTRPMASLYFSGGTLHHRIAVILRRGESRPAPWFRRLVAPVLFASTIVLAMLWPSGDHLRDGATTDDRREPNVSVRRLGPVSIMPNEGDQIEVTRSLHDPGMFHELNRSEVYRHKPGCTATRDFNRSGANVRSTWLARPFTEMTGVPS